ncbi:hypothetical protein ACFYOT_41675 [Saccharothrix saharensis]|uniref:hypothetical protein n=1 Tax=Saccharothrix saharensis TaxID=571190 RepID=UPI0036C1826A
MGLRARGFRSRGFAHDRFTDPGGPRIGGAVTPTAVRHQSLPCRPVPAVVTAGAGQPEKSEVESS